MDGLEATGLDSLGTSWNMIEFVEMEILGWHGSNLNEFCLLS